MLMSTKRLYTVLRLHINNRSTYRNDIIRSGCVRTVSFGPSLAATHQLQRDKIRENLSLLDGETSTKTNISTTLLPRRYCQVRYLSSKKNGPQDIVKSYRDVVDVDSSDEDNWNKLKDEDFFDDDYDPEQEDNENDSGEPKSWKDVTHTLSGFRADKVIAAGLGISRKQVEDAFLSGKLRFNGEILTKKSRKVEINDTLDLIKSQHGNEDGTIDVMRVILKKINDEKTKKDKFVAVLRCWKHLSVPKPKKR